MCLLSKVFKTFLNDMISLDLQNKSLLVIGTDPLQCTESIRKTRVNVGYFVVVLPILEGGRIMWRQFSCRLRRLQSTMSLSVYMNRFIAGASNTPPPFQRPSADYLQPHSGNYGNFLRRLMFALASTFLCDSALLNTAI